MVDFGKSWLRAHILVAVILVLVGSVYVFNAWSPSSYAFIFDRIGITDQDPSFGKARPIRSDEYAVLTALTQATVNNGFERYNKTSLYGEDLRINFGLPIHDWGLLFKPSLSLFGLVNPAYAFSFHWFLITAAFLVGYAMLFKWFGAGPILAYALSAGLYFTGFVQFWWNSNGSTFAFFPWLLLPFATRWRLSLKLAASTWITASWLLTNFYPPFQVSLAFVGLVILFVKAPNLFRSWRLFPFCLAAGIAAAIAGIYLWDYLQQTSATIYPGQRRVGGGSIPWRHWVSWIIPALNFTRDFRPLIPPNICEIGTLGLYYTMATICFMDWGRWRHLDSAQRNLLLVLGFGATLLILWMAFPLPWWSGAPLLWHHVPPLRMQFAGGVLLVLFLFASVQALGLRLSFFRLLLFSLNIILGWLKWKYRPGADRWEDLVILPAVLAAFAVAKRRPRFAHEALAIASLSSGLVLFGGFNPLQSAWAIFNRTPTAITKALDDIARENQGVLAVSILPGATANGLGYRSLSHVTATPKLDYWREQFPGMQESTRNRIFNRYSWIVPTPERFPRVLSPDSVGVPQARFLTLGEVVVGIASPAELPEKGGKIETARIQGGALILTGWAPWEGELCDQGLEIAMNPPPSGPILRSLQLRPDLPKLLGRDSAIRNGFSLRIPLVSGTDQVRATVIARGTAGKRMLLENPQTLPYATEGSFEKPRIPTSKK